MSTFVAASSAQERSTASGDAGLLNRNHLCALTFGLVLMLLCISNSVAFDSTIQSIQRNLTTLGHAPGSADGVDGPRTRTAIDSVAASRGIDPATSDAEVAIAIAQLAQEQTGPDPETALSIQKLLVDLGYVPGHVDGLWDETSRKTLALFLANENGLGPLDGEDRTAAEKHRDALKFMESFKSRVESGATEKLFVPLGGDTPKG